MLPCLADAQQAIVADSPGHHVLAHWRWLRWRLLYWHGSYSISTNLLKLLRLLAHGLAATRGCNNCAPKRAWRSSSNDTCAGWGTMWLRKSVHECCLACCCVESRSLCVRQGGRAPSSAPELVHAAARLGRWPLRHQQAAARVASTETLQQHCHPRGHQPPRRQRLLLLRPRPRPWPPLRRRLTRQLRQLRQLAVRHRTAHGWPAGRACGGATPRRE